jgi:hypothetical protein
LENKNAKTNNLQENKISVFAETRTGSDNSKVYREKKNMKILQKYKVANTRETAHLPETLKQKPKEPEDMKKGKTSTPKINVQ